MVIFNELKKMMISRKTLKRKIGAALTEKILMMFEERWACGQGHLLFLPEEKLDFSMAKFLKEFDFKNVEINKETLESGYNPILEQNNSIKLKDYIESKQCIIRSFNFQCLVNKKENLLFSKNEQKYKIGRKELKKREKDEDNILEFVEEKITYNNNFKVEIDLTEKNYKSRILIVRKEKLKEFSETQRGRTD